MPVQTLQSYATSLAAHRVLLYVVFSLGAVAAVIANALKGQSNFYSVAVFLSRSNGSVVVLGNFGVLIALLCGRLFQQVFFGPLRALEVERLYDRTWFFITESLLAFTIFRDDFDVPFASMFGLLLFTKCFHWLLSDRIEWMDQRPYPGPPLSFYLRVNILFTLLWVTDWLALLLLSENMLAHGLDGKILFASELFVLLACLFNSFAKYLICIVDLRRASARGGENAPPWDDKSMWVFYVELCTDFLKLVTYLIFFTLVLSVYGLPLNIVRDVYITGRSFIMRCRDLVNYRTATRNMDERYPSATDAELNALSDKTCIICREEMVGPVSPPPPDQSGNESGQDGQPAAAVEQGERTLNNARPPDAVPEGPNTVPKRLPCGHIFHFQCLRAWLERQQNCPTCRHSVFEQPRVNGNANANLPPPNLFADGQGQQVPQQGNGGGIFGRIVGAAGAPPIVPGQFAQGPGQAQPPQQAQFGLAPGQNGAPQQGTLYLPRHQLFVAPPERFEGFVLPNGNWVPWPRLNDDRTAQPEVPGNASDTAPSSSENSSNIVDGRPSGSSAAAPGQSDPARGTPIAPPTDSTSPTSPAVNSQDSSSTSAREAARAAALRRFGSSASGVSRPAPKPTAQALNNISTASANENGPETPRTQIQTESNVAPTRTSQGFSVAPDLIPLYDPRVAYPLTPSSQHASSQVAAPDLANRGSQQAGHHSSASTLTTSSQTEVQPNSQTDPTSQPESRRLAMQNLRDLPQQLSIEQLTSLDQLTRESIDERLRVLENVEAATARCITELLRCRSVLPRPSPASPQTVQPNGRPNDEQGASSSHHDPLETPVSDEVTANAQEVPTPTQAETTA